MTTTTQNIQLRRCFALIKALTRNRFGLTKNEILEIYTQEKIPLPSPRTFHRDIDEMRLIGYDISCSKNYRYKLENREEVIGDGFSVEEIQALQMCRDFFKCFDGTQLKDSIDSAINAVVGSKSVPFSRKEIDEFRENFMVYSGEQREPFSKKEFLDTVVFGVNNSVKLKITYTKPIRTRIIEPYKIYLQNDSFYLLAKPEKENKLLSYKISEFVNVEETDEKFVKNRNLSKLFP